MKISKDETRQAHPGWAVQFEDGTWLCIAHGVGQADDAFYASTYDTKESAQAEASYCLKDGEIDPNYKVVEAWEPCCEVMRHRVRTLQEANKIDPGDIMDMTWQLEQIIATLNKGSPK